MARRVNKEVVTENIKKVNAQKDLNTVAQRNLVKQIKEETQEMLLPTLKEEMEKTTELIVKTLNEKGANNVNNIQIMSMISKRSLLEIARGEKVYIPLRK